MTRPTREKFEAALPRVRSWVALRDERLPEILTQVAPQWGFWASVVNLHPERNRWTIELLQCALQFSMLITQRMKHALACPRPIEYDATLQPIVMTPPYGAFPGGHAVEAWMFARVFAKLSGQTRGKGNEMLDALERLSLRITENRVVAGLHFAVDGAAGFVLGDLLAEHFLLRCGASDDALLARTFNGSAFDPEADFIDSHEVYDGTVAAWGPAELKRPQSSELMKSLWDHARAEWVAQGFGA